MENTLYKYLLHLGDNAHVLGHRLAEWCGHGPVLEQDIAITNMSLDLIGQARMYYQYAAEIEGKGRTEDDVAFLRDNREFYNFLLCEQPNKDWGHTIIRQFFYDTWQLLFLEGLTGSADDRLQAIAMKSIKEARYHYKYSSEWTIRLGDGTEESHERMQKALEDLWMYSGEPVVPTMLDMKMYDDGIAPDLRKIKPTYNKRIAEVLKTATLKIPENNYMQTGGKEGVHTEHLGYILADMQFMQRAYPNMQW
jgi:ring-1,2-phenylacetyl-CoA epoxidase subunit PaaC